MGNSQTHPESKVPPPNVSSHQFSHPQPTANNILSIDRTRSASTTTTTTSSSSSSSNNPLKPNTSNHSPPPPQPQSKSHPYARLSRAEKKIAQLQNFGPDLKRLEGRTDSLLKDQTSLNVNLLYRLQLPQVSASPQGPPSIMGPLHHPYLHFDFGRGDKSGGGGADGGVGMDGDVGVDVDMEMNDAEAFIDSRNPIHPKAKKKVLPPTPTQHLTLNRSIPPSSSSHHPTPNPPHPLLHTRTTTTPEQIDLELSHLILSKHNELRLINTELAKAQIMLEQLRRAHLKPFIFLRSEWGEWGRGRIVVRDLGGERGMRMEEEEGGMRLRSRKLRDPGVGLGRGGDRGM